MRISMQVERRVLRAVKETGYRPNVVSRSLRTGSTQTIGLISDTVATTSFAGHLIWGALDAARERGHLLFVAETEGDPELEQQSIEAMHDRRVEGVVLASMFTRQVTVPQALSESPTVLLNALPAAPSNVASVIPDEVEAGRTSARVLLRAGHREGIYLVGVGLRPEQVPRESLAAKYRLQGIKEVVEDAGVHLAGGVFCADWQPGEGYEAVRRLLRRTTPRAFICFNDRLSMGAYQALEDAGVKVPTEVSVVSFDDEPLASWLRPALTTIALPHYELGRRAVEVLLGHGSPKGTERVHRVHMPLRERDSVAELQRRAPP
jgi:LacI family transcriptional regulator